MEHKAKLLSHNVYKIIKTDQPNEYCFGCGDGMYFATYEHKKFTLLNDKLFEGLYVTQLCLLSRGSFLCSIWN